MIQCPNCQNQEPLGALFCTYCGTQLFTGEDKSTQSIYRSQSDPLLQTDKVVTSAMDKPVESDPQIELNLHILNNDQVINLTGRNEYTLGRVAEGQPILPEVDLSPYEAYSQGVSRLHASLRISGRQVILVDLGSSNGTRLNGNKITPNTEYPVKHGDLIKLGKMKIQIILRR